MLLNLSNHPFATWTLKQCEAAEAQFGRVVDMPFPAIHPSATTKEVQALAQSFLTQIQALRPQAVHLMGELSFCFALAHLLQKTQTQCVVSTSTRNSALNPDGTKTVLFDFVQFRDYPMLV